MKIWFHICITYHFTYFLISASLHHCDLDHIPKLQFWNSRAEDRLSLLDQITMHTIAENLK